MRYEEEAMTSASTAMKRENSGLLCGKIRYKFWALAALLVLAFWSFVTGTVTLKWSAGNLTHFSDDVNSSVLDDLDILEVEEREKVVRKMWDVYTHTKIMRLPKFWEDAFEAAYEYLVSEDSGVRDAAILEIAKLSVMSFDDQDSPPVQAKNRETTKEKEPKLPKKVAQKNTTKAAE